MYNNISHIFQMALFMHIFLYKYNLSHTKSVTQEYSDSTIQVQCNVQNVNIWDGGTHCNIQVITFFSLSLKLFFPHTCLKHN